jgi:hypothetical protein
MDDIEGIIKQRTPDVVNSDGMPNGQLDAVVVFAAPNGVLQSLVFFP